MREPLRMPRGRGATDPLSKFLAYLGDLEAALARKEPLRVTALLRKRTATHLPRDVREELLMLMRLPGDRARAPVRFLRFQHRMRELAAGGEPLPRAGTESRPAGPVVAGVVRRHARDAHRPAASDPAAGTDATDAATASPSRRPRF